MNPETPTVGFETTIVSEGKETRGVMLGKLNLPSFSAYSDRDASSVNKVIALFTSPENKNPFERVAVFTLKSLLTVKSRDSKDFEADHTLDSIKLADRLFEVSERFIPDEVLFNGVSLKGGQRIFIEDRGELVLMNVNSVTYDNTGKAFLLLTRAEIRNTMDFVAALTAEEFSNYYVEKLPTDIYETRSIQELLCFMIANRPDGIEASEVGIRDGKISVEMIRDCWNDANKRLPRENKKNLFSFGLRGAEGAFFRISDINEEFGNHLVRLFRGEKN